MGSRRQHRSRSLVLSVVLVASSILLLGASGCKPRLGKKCSPEGKEVCAGKGAALLCLEGKWTTMACRGAKGCSGEGAVIECDQSVARATEVCNLESSVTCSEDKRSSLACKDNAWQPSESCGGPQGCTRGAQGASCDSSIARENDKCTHPGSQACSQEKRSRLSCVGGRFTAAENCRGPEGCKSTGRRVLCDNSLAVAGEPCDTPENVACSTDFRSILVCREGKYAVDTKCKMTTSCHVEGTKVGCFE